MDKSMFKFKLCSVCGDDIEHGKKTCIPFGNGFVCKSCNADLQVTGQTPDGIKAMNGPLFKALEEMTLVKL